METEFKTVNPATGRTEKEFPSADDAVVEETLAASSAAYEAWRETPIEERARPMVRAAELMEERVSELAPLLTLEMGKLPQEAEAEVQLCARILRYYGEEGPRLLKDETLSPASGGEAVVKHEPIGPLVGVMPWNFPYYQVVRIAAPNLVAGNTVIIKHAASCPQSALAISAIFQEAGLPDGCYRNIFAQNDQVAAMIADERVSGASLTGSEGAGSAVASTAGEHLKKFVLELGGDDPFVVLDTSDMESTVGSAVAGRMTNAGQSCIASKRMIVMEDHYDDFVRRLTEQMAGFTMGDPFDEATDLPPLSSETAAQSLMEQVDDAVAKGATVHTGGGRPDGPGAFVEATVLTDVTPDMRAYSEELFGPVAVVCKVADEEEAVALANDSSFGLGGTVISDDVARAQRVADRIDTGMVWINHTTWTEPDLPFGGTKRSGVGRELGEDGILEFVNRKLVRTP
ncbi:MAG: NAD-dependent succinate-semialdehyde dehydrogenase [Nesterenkonia sp.]|nr:NAD-dependent succinate-semialdehyde dehydrogenase [Nesterenkonia sp.]